MPVRLVSHEEPLPGYRLLERLGRGGFGEVWKAEAPGGLMKAIKFVFGDLESADEDGRPAEQELKALHRVKSIRHPYILSLERFDVVDGQLIIVMELADRNLWDRFRECRSQGLPGIPRAELMQYMEESAEALDLMNNHYQIQHLDVKPQNIFLVFNHVKVADFGLAKAFEGMKATVTGGVTPVYAAPETFEGWVSRFSDQYSLAIVFQEMLTGTRPITGANTKQLLLAHLNSIPDVAPLPIADRAIIGRALSKTPDDRWPTCMDMVRALRSAGTGVISRDAIYRSRPDTDTPRPSSHPHTPPAAKPGSGPVRPVGSGAFAVTPRPLVTPRLVTQQGNASGATAHTMPRQQVLQTGRMNTLGIAPPDRDGPGVLFPALVVGVGQTGLAVLKKLRQLVRDRFGNPEAISTLRLLYIDTDPETAAAATSGPDALLPREVVLARLNRPAHYLQQSGGQYDRWMPPGLLYQLPKTPGAAAGVRAFGRLALCDNYRLIAQRVRQEIETFLTDDPLEKVAEQTGLGFRTNRPRAYVVAGLAGGTGSGMLTDLAYILKHELRGVGYRKPETVGVLLVPPGDKATRQPAALANTFAALAEVRHFTAGEQYRTRFENNEAPIVDGDGPFSRCAVLQLPKVPKERERSRVLGLAARGLFVELFTPAGRVADSVRDEALAEEAAAPAVQSFGLYRLSWPRMQLLLAASRRFSQGLLQRWAGRDSSHLKQPIREWLVDQWDKQKLDATTILARLELAVRESLQQTPESLFDATVAPLRIGATARVDADAACEVLEQLVKLVGRPEGEQDTPGSLGLVIHATRQAFLKELETGLATIAVSFIEQPQYRLAGAEEALTQLSARLTEASHQLETARLTIMREIRDIVTRLANLLNASGAPSNKKTAVTAEVLEALRAYPTKRLRQAQLDAVLAVYRTVLGNLPEYARDVNYCRTRLGELCNTLGGAEQVPSADSGLSTLLLPVGCNSLDEVADQFLGSLLADDILAFDQELQTEIKRRVRGVVSVCLKPHRSSDFLALLTARARTFLDERLGHANPAAMFLTQRGDGPDALKMLAEGYEAAAPGLKLDRPTREVALLAAPPGLEGERLRRLAAKACPGAEFRPAPLTDDLMLYREYPRVELTTLPQLGPQARDAYESQLAAGGQPHARADVTWPVPGC
jgi:serine/threonine protein kinase